MNIGFRKIVNSGSSAALTRAFLKRCSILASVPGDLTYSSRSSVEKTRGRRNRAGAERPERLRTFLWASESPKLSIHSKLSSVTYRSSTLWLDDPPYKFIGWG